MAPARADAYNPLLSWVRALGALILFAALFLALFWTPAVLLSAFAAGVAASASALSQTFDRGRRRIVIVREARAFRGGWFDSSAQRLG